MPVLGPEEHNDSLMQTDLLRAKGTPLPISEGVSGEGVATQRGGRISISSQTPELVEPKLLREIREARRQEEIEEKERKIAV